MARGRNGLKSKAYQLVRKQLEVDHLNDEIQLLKQELLPQIERDEEVSVDGVNYLVQRIDQDKDVLYPPEIVHDRMDDPEDFYSVISVNKGQLKKRFGEKVYYGRFVKETVPGSSYLKVVVA